MKVVLVPGTWANTRGKEGDDWWKANHNFYNILTARGYEVLSFEWDTKLDGVIGDNDTWERAGRRMVKTVPDGCIVIAHSHGGQVASYAAEYGLYISQLITIATPVRAEVNYAEARKNIDNWIHIYGKRDWTQLLGELAIGEIRTLRRQMPLADMNVYYPAGHSDLRTAAVWNDANYWALLKSPTGA